METRKENKTYTKEVVTYIAYDGKEFSSSEECVIYEKSAECAVRMDLFKFRANKNSLSGEDFNKAHYDGKVFGVEISNQEALHALRVFMKYKRHRDEWIEKFIGDDLLGKKIILFSNGGDDDYWFCTYDGVLSEIDSLFQKESKIDLEKK